MGWRRAGSAGVRHVGRLGAHGRIGMGRRRLGTTNPGEVLADYELQDKALQPGALRAQSGRFPRRPSCSGPMR